MVFEFNDKKILKTAVKLWCDRDTNKEVDQSILIRKTELNHHDISTNDINFDEFPNIDHVHNFSWYVGNYPSLEMEKIELF